MTLRVRAALCAGLMLCASPLAAAGSAPVVVELTTDLGKIDIALSTAQAPLTSANFLRYVDRHLYDGASFYRVVTASNDHNPSSKVDLIQGGLKLDIPPLGYIPHETTAQTGLRHLAGTISMARDKPGTAGSEFFIELKPDPSADYGGARNPDRQGFAAFGQVVGGMDVVRAIYAEPTDAPETRPYYLGQTLRHPVIILTARRLAALHAAGPWRPLDPADTLVIDTTKGQLVIEMRPDLAPNAVARIKLLAREHLYDGLLFHRVLANFVDQTGNPNNHDGGTSSHPNLQPEFKFRLDPSQVDAVATVGQGEISGFVGSLPIQASIDPAHPGQWRAWAAYCDGVAGMGRQADLGSANSEIFFMRAPSRLLDHDFTAWGRVVSGLDAVKAIAVGEPPADPDRMIRVRVMADMPPAEQPRLAVADTRSASFKRQLADERHRRGADFSVCDVAVQTRLDTAPMTRH